MIKDILLPNIGEGVETADVSDVLVAVGDSIKKDDAILVLESEKATMEIPSDYSGTIKAVFVNNGDQISSGQKLLSIEISDSQETEMPAKEQEEKELITPKATELKNREKPIAPPVQSTLPDKIQSAPFASPAVRRYARELGANIQFVRGSGTKGRIVKEDVQNYIKEQLASQGMARPTPQPKIDFSKWGPIEKVSLNKIRRITGERMTTAWQTVPQVTNFDKVDTTELDAHRRSAQNTNTESEVRITLLPYIMKACCRALVKFPDVNSSLSAEADGLILKKHYHIRIAVDTPEGLMVPVLRDVDKKDIFELSKELSEISQKARNKRLMPDDLSGGTFTISSLGGIGGTYFTPIVNPPEVAILGVSRSQFEQVYNGKSFDKKLMLPLTLSYDHRVVDGALAANFMKYLNQLLSDINKLSEINII